MLRPFRPADGSIVPGNFSPGVEMHALKWVGGGLAAGLIGAAVWAGIAYAFHVQIGWIAWGIGFLVGLGVRVAAGETYGPAPGMVAAVIAVAAIQVGKFAAVFFVVSGVNPEVNVTAQDMIASQADEVVKQRTAAGKPVRWPAGMSLDKASEQEDYPADVWQEATKAWNKLPPAEQQQRTAARTAEVRALVGELKGHLTWAAFKDSYSPFDILWCLLAVLSAYKLGSGLSTGE